MNARERFLRIQRVKNLIGAHRRLNCFMVNPESEGDRHVGKKFQLWYEMRKLGINLYCEPRLLCGKIPDLMTEIGDVYEIVNTESAESIEKKKREYPKELDLHFVHADKDIKEVIEEMMGSPYVYAGERK